MKSSARALVIDDQNIVCESCRRALEKVGTEETEILIFGLEAFRRQARNPIPVVRKIRGDIPIIVVSSDQSKKLAQNVRRGGSLFYLAEPFGAEDVKAVIRGAAKKVPFFKKAVPVG